MADEFEGFPRADVFRTDITDTAEVAEDVTKDLWDVGKVQIDTLALFKFENIQENQILQTDLTERFAAIEITQSIFSPFMTMDVAIGASAGMVERFGTFGLQGEEFIFIDCYTPQRTRLKMTFYVTNVEVEHDELNQASSVLFTCVSKEKLINDISSINQSYIGTSSKIAEKVFNNKIANNTVSKKLKGAASIVWDKPLIAVMDSYQEEDIIIPGKTPFAAIDMCARRAYGGAAVPSSFYTFYQTPYGFRFDSVEELIKEELLRVINEEE